MVASIGIAMATFNGREKRRIFNQEKKKTSPVPCARTLEGHLPNRRLGKSIFVDCFIDQSVDHVSVAIEVTLSQICR